MVLTFAQRILLLQILPDQGNIVTLRVVQDLRKSLAATEEEIKEHNIIVENVDGKSNIKWDPEFSTDIEMGDIAKQIIAEQLKDLNEKKELTENMVSLYDLFVNPTKTEEVSNGAN